MIKTIWASPRGNLKLQFLNLQFQITLGRAIRFTSLLRSLVPATIAEAV